MVIAVALIGLAAFSPAASHAGGQDLVGGYANYTLKLSGNINDTLSFLVGNYNSTTGVYRVQQDLGSTSTTTSVDSGNLYTAFPVLAGKNATSVVNEMALSPLNSFGYSGLIENHSRATLSNLTGSRVTVPAGTFNALEFNDTAVSSGNGSYTSLTINCFVDSATGIILTLQMHVDSNGTLLSSAAELMSSNIAQKAFSGWNIPLLVSGAGISIVAVFVTVLMIQRKK